MSEREHADPEVQRLEAENRALRNTLAADNESLRSQIAATAQQASGGLTDADIRRIEHPDEFADDDGDDADGDPATIAPVAPAQTTGPHDLTEHAVTASEPSAALEPSPGPDAAQTTAHVEGTL